MGDGKIKFGIGLLVGIVLAALFFMYFAPRYQTAESGGVLYKHDRWSGESWRHSDSGWKKVSQHDRDWDGIDDVLKAALNIPETNQARSQSLKQLRERYPVLKELSDEEILERIKMVYARDVLSNLYLESFLQIQRQNQTVKGRESD